MRPNLTTEYLKECFNYNPETGVARWKRRPLKHFVSKATHDMWNKRHAGKIPGTKVRGGNKARARAMIDGYYYFINEIAWALAKDAWPDKSVYNSDGNILNFKMENLTTLNPNSVAARNLISPKIDERVINGLIVSGLLTKPSPWVVGGVG